MSTNTNPETGIRFGTIYLHHLDPDTAAWLWGQAENISEREAYKDLRAEIEREVQWDVDEGRLDPDAAEDEVEHRFERASENLQIEEPYLEGECEGVKYGISHLGGAALLWVYESPHTGTFALCSPCVPGACDLESPSNSDEYGYVGYDVPADWRAQS